MKRAFIIIESDPIVSMDLAGTLKSVFPRSDLSIARSIPEARRLVLSDQDAICVIVNSKFVTDSDLPFLQKLVASSGHLMCLGEPINTGFPNIAVAIPFTADMIVEAISNVVSDPNARPLEDHT